MRTTIIMARSRGLKTVAAGLGMGILAAGLALSQDRFAAKPADKYPAKQSQGDVIIAVKPFRTDKDMKAAFDKAEPYKYGFMPMLLVITNNSQHPLNLATMKVRYIDGDRTGLEPIPGEDLAYFNPKGRNKPNTAPLPIPGVVWRRGGKKGPLAKPEITQREFKAPVVPPESSVHGFFYYQTGNEGEPVSGASMYISGIRDMTTARELFYYEIPLDTYRGK